MLLENYRLDSLAKGQLLSEFMSMCNAETEIKPLQLHLILVAFDLGKQYVHKNLLYDPSDSHDLQQTLASDE